MEIDFFGKQPTEVIFYTKTGSIKKVFDTFLKAYHLSYKAFEQYDFITGYQIN